MDTRLLASCGRTIKLWRTDKFSLCQDIPSANGRVLGLSWNQDGQCIASLGETGEEILLSAITGLSSANIGVLRTIESPSCLQFTNRASQYLGVGSQKGVVAIWNVKSRAQKKVFTVTDCTITKMCFSHSDSHIATATKRGTLHLLSVVNMGISGPFKIFDNKAVTGLSYSRVKKSLLGCCCEDGDVSLFDCNASKLVHSFPSAHAAPVAALAFSPVNELLMISAGYDKKFACYNVQTKQAMMSHRAPAPLTSAIFLEGGQQVALGTMTGQIFVHDLRSIRAPLTILQAHNTPVTALHLQPSSRRAKSESTMDGTRVVKGVNMAATLQPPQSRPVSRSCSDEASKASPDLQALARSNQPDRDSLEMFSPIRQTEQPAEHVKPGVDCMLGIGTELSTSKDSSGMAFFSPVRQTDHQEVDAVVPVSHRMLKIDDLDFLSPVRNTDKEITSQTPTPGTHETQNMEGPSEANTLSLKVTRDKENIKPDSSFEMDVVMENLPSTRKSELMSASSEEDVSRSPLKPAQAENNKCRQEPHEIEREDSVAAKVTSTHSLAPEYKLLLNRTSVSPGKTHKGIVTKSSIHEGTLAEVKPVVEGEKTAAALPKSPYSRLAPLRKRQMVQPIQAADLAPASPEVATELPEEEVSVAGVELRGGAPPLQVELIKGCLAEVMEEFQDDVNRRLMHLQWIMTKHHLKQLEMMEQLHRQYSLNEDLLQENERLHQEVARLKANY